MFGFDTNKSGCFVSLPTPAAAIQPGHVCAMSWKVLCSGWANTSAPDTTDTSWNPSVAQWHLNETLLLTGLAPGFFLDRRGQIPFNNFHVCNACKEFLLDPMPHSPSFPIPSEFGGIARTTLVISSDVEGIKPATSSWVLKLFSFSRKLQVPRRDITLHHWSFAGMR